MGKVIVPGCWAPAQAAAPHIVVVEVTIPEVDLSEVGEVVLDTLVVNDVHLSVDHGRRLLRVEVTMRGGGSFDALLRAVEATDTALNAAGVAHEVTDASARLDAGTPDAKTPTAGEPASSSTRYHAPGEDS